MPAKKTTTSTRKKTTAPRTRKKIVPTASAKLEKDVSIELTEAAKEVFVRPETPDHIRNLRQTTLRLRFPSQKIKDGDAGYTLKPRGERGDIVKLSDDDLSSTYYSANLDLTFEALTPSQAREIVSKQSINEQTQVHPAMAMLRNELGKPYAEGAIQLEVPFEQQGQVVAHITPNQEGLNHKRVEINRNPGAAPTVQEVPGSQTQNLTPEQLRDAVARDKTTSGPSAGLAGITKVTLGELNER